MDLSGKQVKLIRGEMGLRLEADPSLREEWALDSRVFEEEYLSTAAPEY